MNYKIKTKTQAIPKYEPLKMTRQARISPESDRVSADRAISQRLSPFFGQTENNKPVKDLGPHTIEELKIIEKRTNGKSPVLNQLAQENILVRT